MALGELLVRARDRRPASPSPARPCRAAGAGGRRARSSGSRTSTGLATPSRSRTTRSTVSQTMPRAAARERAADGHLGHAERGEHAARREAERLGGGDEVLDGRRVDRLGPAEGQRQRRQVEVVHPHPSRAARSRAPTRSSARPWPCRRQSLIHCIQLPGWARKSCGAACTSCTPVVIGIDRNPTRPMSWYSGSHDTITSPSAQFGGHAAGVDVGGEHPVGDHHALRLAGRPAGVLEDDEPLRIGRRLRAGRRGPVGAPGMTLPIGSIGGSPAAAS